MSDLNPNQNAPKDLLIMTEDGTIYFIPSSGLGQPKVNPPGKIEALREELRKYAGQAIGLAVAVYADYGVQANGDGLLDTTQGILDQGP